MLRLKGIGRRIKPIYQSVLFVPAVVCLGILLASILGSRAADTTLKRDIQSAAHSRVVTFEQLLASQLDSYEQVLRGGVGLFQGSDNVTKQDFTNYLAAYDMQRNYPAVQAIAYAKAFNTDQTADVVDYLAQQDINDFQLRPIDPTSEHYAAAIYVQSVASENKNPRPGYDGYTDPVRRSAMYQARDQAITSLTPLLNLNPMDRTTAPIAGFNMYVPFYGPQVPATTTERQAALQGYVYASFRGQVFFKNIKERDDAKNITFRIRTTGQHAKTSLFESPNFTHIQGEPDSIKMHRTLRFYNQTWVIDYAIRPNSLVSTIQLHRPDGVLFFGIFSAVLITIILWLLLEGRLRTLTAQKERDIELAKDELLSLASHQLRTPATGVKQYIGMVLQGFAGKVPGQQQKLLEKAYASNERQLQSINEILHLAKISTGHIVLARQNINATAMLQDVIQEQQQDINNAGHSVKLIVGKRPIWLDVDPHMLRMATENILSNAIKYTPAGGKIKITLQRDTKNADIQIADNGVGIQPEDFPKLFKQFSRLPNAISQKTNGTGVGLFLAKYLIELHGGTVTVSSHPGKGSVFTIRVPIASNI